MTATYEVTWQFLEGCRNQHSSIHINNRTFSALSSTKQIDKNQMDSDEYESSSFSTSTGRGTSTTTKRKRESSKAYSAAQEKQRIRAHKNRISAQKSRDKQKQYIVELEATNGEMREKLKMLETQNKLLSEKLDLVLGLLGAKKDESSAIALSADNNNLAVPHQQQQQLQQVPILSLSLPQKSLDSSNSLSVQTTAGPLSSALVSPFASERSMSITSTSLQQQQDDELEMLEFLNSSPTEEHPAPSSLFLDTEAGDSCISDPSTSINTFSAAANAPSFIATEEQKAQFDSLFSQCFDDSLYDQTPSLSNVNALPFSFTNPSFSAYASSCSTTAQQQATTTLESPSTSSSSTLFFPTQHQQHHHHMAQQNQFDLKSDPAAIITDFSTLQQFRSLTFAPQQQRPILSSSLNRISCDPLVSLTLRIPEISLKTRNTSTTTPPPTRTTPLHFFLNWEEEESWKEEKDKIPLMKRCSTPPPPRNGFQVLGPVLGKKKSLGVFEKKFPISFAILQRM